MRRIDLTGARPRTSTGVLAAIGAVAFTTALIYPLREVVPAVSTGVTYLIAVLAISTIWGLRLGLLTALLSALCFNFFHIPPTGRLSIAEGQNWVALAVFFVAAAIASTLAELARSRAEEAERGRREANLSADLARLLLVGVAPEQAFDDVSKRLAGAMGIEWAVVAFDARERVGRDVIVIPLAVDREPEAALLVPADTGDEKLEQLRERVAPALATLLTAAVERRRLGAEAVEAQALRRSDELKTALLRSVSHDLRTPLTSIVAAGEALGSAGITAEERSELAQVVQLESARLSRLVDQLLDLSRLEAGAADPRREWSSLEEIVQAAADQIPGGTSSSSSTPTCRSSTPTGRSSSGRSPMCSRTRRGIPRASPSRFTFGPSARGWCCGSSTAGPASRSRSSSGSSNRSTAASPRARPVASARAWGWRWPADSSPPTEAPSGPNRSPAREPRS